MYHLTTFEQIFARELGVKVPRASLCEFLGFFALYLHHDQAINREYLLNIISNTILTTIIKIITIIIIIVIIV